jgi:hypothetical protein
MFGPRISLSLKSTQTLVVECMEIITPLQTPGNADSKPQTLVGSYIYLVLKSPETLGGNSQGFNLPKDGRDPWLLFLHTLKRYCPANSNRGQYYAQIIRPHKLEARPLFFLNFKGTPSQEEHKTIFSGLKINKMALSGSSATIALFSTIFSVILTLTFHSLSVPDCQFSKT